MNSFRSFVRELHQRSVWQVLGVFLAASWGVLQVVETVTESVGLPDWTPGMAFVLLLIGLPVVLATAIIQEGPPGASTPSETTAGEEGDAAVREPSSAEAPESAHGKVARALRSVTRLFTWRNAILGGVGAFALLGFSLVAYFVMWEAGIGPVGSLEAQGVFADGEPIVLADFENRSNDPTLGSVVTEAVRVDLASSTAIALLSAAQVGEILSLMQRDPSAGLPASVAREVAIRAGVKAVVDGEVGSAGTGYILTAAIREADSGQPLATFRRTASSADKVIEAIDGISQDIRQRAGESLRSIKSEAPLERFTTSSLAALRLYSEGEMASERGESARARELLEEAVGLDPEFAMAWRKLSTVYRVASTTPEQEVDAATRAYELRDRLTPRERLHATAYYHSVVTSDVGATIRTYEEILRQYPTDARSLNNISLAYASSARWEEALEYLGMARSIPGAPLGTVLTNSALFRAALGRAREAREAAEELREVRQDGEIWVQLVESVIALLEDDPEEAIRFARELQTHPEASDRFHNEGFALELEARLLQGRWEEGERDFRDAIDRERRAGRSLEVIQMTLQLALARQVVFDDARGSVSMIRALLDDGALDGIPPHLRPHRAVIEALGQLGAADLASERMDAWRREGGVVDSAVMDDLGLVVDAIGAEGPEAKLAGIDRFRAASRCDRCYAWLYAGLLAEAGRLREAVDETRRAMTGQQPIRMADSFTAVRIFGHERMARWLEEAGDTAGALEHYRAFVGTMPEADATMRARKDRARARITSLGG